MRRWSNPFLERKQRRHGGLEYDFGRSRGQDYQRCNNEVWSSKSDKYRYGQEISKGRTCSGALVLSAEKKGKTYNLLVRCFAGAQIKMMEGYRFLEICSGFINTDTRLDMARHSFLVDIDASD